MSRKGGNESIRGRELDQANGHTDRAGLRRHRFGQFAISGIGGVEQYRNVPDCWESTAQDLDQLGHHILGQVGQTGCVSSRSGKASDQPLTNRIDEASHDGWYR